MFSSKHQLSRRTPENGTNRENFLSQLVDEYLNSTTLESKYQVLANLANIAYDPINYEYIRNVGVLDIFLYVLKSEKNGKLIHFATAGLCNLCIDPLNADYILSNLQLDHLTDLLQSKHTETVANVITTLMYLSDNQNKSRIVNPEVVQTISNLQKSSDSRIANLATIFLQDVCQIH